VSKTERKDVILDSAEKLFALRGFENVSMRDVAEDANEDVTLVQYHFKKKDKLFEQAIARGAKDFLGFRTEILDRMEFDAAPNPLTIEQIVEAFLSPLVMAAKSDELHWNYYLQLLMQASNADKWADVLNKNFDQSARRIVVALQRTLSDVDKPTIFLCMHFIYSSIILAFSGNQRISRLSDGVFEKIDLDSLANDTILFVSAGIKAIVDSK
jgi:AcrR family transcriptional regulator